MDNNKDNIITIDLTHLFEGDWMSHILNFQPSIIDHETEVKIRDKFWFYDSVEKIKYPSIRESIMNSLEYQLYERIKRDSQKLSNTSKCESIRY